MYIFCYLSIAKPHLRLQNRTIVPPIVFLNLKILEIEIANPLPVLHYLIGNHSFNSYLLLLFSSVIQSRST